MKNNPFYIDELGRVVIVDTELVNLVSGAESSIPDILVDGGCHDNGGCSNQSCTG